MSTDKTLLKSAGAALIAGSLAFVAVFSYLAATFGYPDVLDHSAAQVLPLLTRGGQTLRTVWFIYGALPLMFVLAGVASGRILERTSPRTAHAGGGRRRHRGRGDDGPACSAGPPSSGPWPGTGARRPAPTRSRWRRSSMPPTCSWATWWGSSWGEICTATWFLALGLAWRRQGRRWFGSVGVAAAALMALAALRNITPLVDLISDINNIALPLWLIAMGVAFWREAGRPPRGADPRAATPALREGDADGIPDARTCEIGA